MAEPRAINKPRGTIFHSPTLLIPETRPVPTAARVIAMIFLAVILSPNKNQAMMVTKMGALHCTTVASAAPIITTALFHKTWKIPMLMAPIPISQGRSFFLITSRLGLMISIPASNNSEVVKSRQKASPTADRPLCLIIRLMKIPEVPQHAVAVTTSKTLDSLLVMGLRLICANFSSFFS